MSSPIPIHSRPNLPASRLDAISTSVAPHTTLEKLIASGFTVTEIIAADEFSLDAVVPFEDNLTLVYHLT